EPSPMVALTRMGSGEVTFTAPTLRTNRKLLNLSEFFGIKIVRFLLSLVSWGHQPLGAMTGVSGSNVTVGSVESDGSAKRLNVALKGVMLLVRMERCAKVPAASANVKMPLSIA